jgi:hypothetical protein
LNDLLIKSPKFEAQLELVQTALLCPALAERLLFTETKFIRFPASDFVNSDAYPMVVVELAPLFGLKLELCFKHQLLSSFAQTSSVAILMAKYIRSHNFEAQRN